MSKWKTNNDGYCAYCGTHTRLHQPEDWGKSKSTKWLCRKCLLRHFHIDITKDKTHWGSLLYPYHDYL